MRKLKGNSQTKFLVLNISQLNFDKRKERYIRCGNTIYHESESRNREDTPPKKRIMETERNGSLRLYHKT